VQFVRDVVSIAAETGALVWLDVGGNDMSVTTVAGNSVSDADLELVSIWGLAEAGRIDVFSGVPMTVAYLLSDDPNDLAQLPPLLDSALRGKDLLLVRNAGVLGNVDPTAGDPWAAIEASAIYKRALKMGTKPVTIPSLPRHISHRLTEAGASFVDAVKGRPVGKEPMSLWERQALQTYLVQFEKAVKSADIGGLL
jgi:hypothetical protein